MFCHTSMDTGFSAKCWAPYSGHCSSKPAMCSFSSSMRKHGGTGSNGFLSQSLAFLSPCEGSIGMEARSVKRACGSSFEQLPDEELANQIEGLADLFDVPDEDGGRFDGHEAMEKHKEVACAVSDGYRCRVLKNTATVERDLSTRFSTVKLETLEPSLLGIQPDPPDWPERKEIVRSRIERKANSVQLPLSLRVIRRKNQRLWQEGFKGAGGNSNSSINKAFASMVYTFQALQSHALFMRECHYSENRHGAENLHAPLAKAQREMNVSFVWLFQRVFGRTPLLTVDLIVLLANFSVFSITENEVLGGTPSSSIEGMLSLADDKSNNLSPDTSERESWQERSATSISYPDAVQNKQAAETALHGDNKLTAEEIKLWNNIVLEASRLAEESGTGFKNHDTLNLFISPVSVEVEVDNFEDYRKTDIAYQKSIFLDPNNPLLLSNYGQFLYLVAHDYDRAEKCFKSALEIDPQDSESLVRYADFLWMVRKDAWGAEESYLQAIAADPGNSYHASKYANFLWSTGGEETCFPLASYTQ